MPDCLLPLVEQGIIREVVRPLLSGKEAQIYLVDSGGELRVAKAYKDARQRSFKHRAQYTEGRKVRNSRDQRAMAKGTRYGKARDEAGWKSTEVDVIYRLRDAGVRVPEPFIFADGVLVMELVTDAAGEPASRLSDLHLDRSTAQRVFDQLLREVVKMLCAGIVHGDLSDYNVLMGPDGPVVIDFPQALNAAGNSNAQRILVRDVGNLYRFLRRHLPGARRYPYGQEIWAAYERTELTPDYELTGRFTPAPQKTTTKSLLDEIAEVERENRQRRRALGLEDDRAAYVFSPVTAEEVAEFTRAKAAARSKAKPGGEQAPRKKRRRRRKKGGPQTDQGGARTPSTAAPGGGRPDGNRSSAGPRREGRTTVEARSPDRSRANNRNRNRNRSRKRNDNRTAPRNG